MASGPERFRKFGRLVPHWVTAARCARAPGSGRRSPRGSSPSGGDEGGGEARARRSPAVPARGRARRHVTPGALSHVNCQKA